MDQLDERLISHWRDASRDLGIRVVAPYALTEQNSVAIACEVFLPDFGSATGAILISAKTERRIRSTQALAGLWVSVRPDKQPREYKRSQIIDELIEFGWFGPSDGRPHWFVERR